MNTVILYTDGACSGNPGPGGWGAILMCGDLKKEISGGCLQTTNNRMELTAVVEGLKSIKNAVFVKVYSDSAYCVNAFTNGWIDKWKKNGWRNSSKDEVKNIDLWEQLLAFCGKYKITWHKVKGHSDNEYNNRCDELARAEIKKLKSD